MAGFLGHACVEHDLEQQIAEFAAQVSHIIASDGVSYLVGFFDGVRRDRPEILRDIPFAAALRIAEAGHDAKEAVEFVGHVRMIIYIMLN